MYSGVLQRLLCLAVERERDGAPVEEYNKDEHGDHESVRRVNLSATRRASPRAVL